MTDSNEKIDSSSDTQNVEYKEGTPSSDVSDEIPQSGSRGLDTKPGRDAVKFHYSPSFHKSEVSIHIDTEIIARKDRADELNGTLEE